MEIEERWEKLEKELEKRPWAMPTEREDLKAFNLLNKLVPGKDDILAAAEHDQVFLAVDGESLNKVATDEEIKTLIACGVHYDSHYESLYMFV
jgi:hypothetical protein